MPEIHVWTGGPHHPFVNQSAWIKGKLEPEGNPVLIREDLSVFEPESLAKAGLLVMMGLSNPGIETVDQRHWDNPSARGPHQPLQERHVQALLAHLGAGKPLLALHGGLISFPECEILTEIIDGRWLPGHGTHDPYMEFRVKVREPGHPLCEGVRDFTIHDELYYDFIEPKHSLVLLEAQWKGRFWPLAWAGIFGKAKVVYCALGHDMVSYSCPAFQKFLENSFKYLLA